MNRVIASLKTSLAIILGGFPIIFQVGSILKRIQPLNFSDSIKFLPWTLQDSYNYFHHQELTFASPQI